MTSDAQLPTLHCANHPDRETMLRCNKCDKPICFQCAVLTEVGYRCRECVRGQRSVYYNGKQLDLPLGALVALVAGALLGAVAYAVLGGIGFFGFLIAFVAGPAAGGLSAEGSAASLGRRRPMQVSNGWPPSRGSGHPLGGLVLLSGQALLGGLPLLAVFLRRLPCSSAST